MGRSSFVANVLVLVAVFLPLTVNESVAQVPMGQANLPNGQEQQMKEHTPPKTVLRSLLAPAIEMPNATPGNIRPYGGTPIDVTTYHYDGYRTGWNQLETDLTPANVGSSNFGLLKTLPVDGNVFMQPLLVSSFVMPDGVKRDILIIATGHNSVYAYDAQTYDILWQVNLGQPQSTHDVGCGDVKPEYGISSTPVIARSAQNAATIYLVSATEPAHLSFHTWLHALDLRTGKDVTPAVEIAPSAKLSNGSTMSFSPQNQWSRAGLAYNNGTIYVGIGSHCDNDNRNISGWLLSYDPNLVLKHAFHTISNPETFGLASIWMTGFAPAVDENGDVFVVTGNGDFTGTSTEDYGESVLRLSAETLSVKDSFTPAAHGTLTTRDEDFGSGGIMLLPDSARISAQPLAAAMGKDAVLYLLNRSALGGSQPNDSGTLQALRLGTSGSGLWGGPAFYDGPAGPTVYTQIQNDVLRAFTISGGTSAKMSLSNKGTTAAGYGGSLPIISSEGRVANTGVVWLMRRSAPIELEAYDAAVLGAPIFTANIGDWSNPGHNNPFLTPMEANGRVYAAAYMTVKVFGLVK